jgi:hypothetical protein
VVGEIYDEDDDEDFEFSEDSITLQEDGTFLVRGDADLEDCDKILQLNLDEEEALKEFSTISGFLCMCAGEIPRIGDFVMGRGWTFEILNADDKRILMVKVERLVGGFQEGEDEETEGPLRGFLKRKQKEEVDAHADAEMNGLTEMEYINGDSEAAISDSDIELEVRRSKEANKEEAEKIERLVQETERSERSLTKCHVKGNQVSNKRTCTYFAGTGTLISGCDLGYCGNLLHLSTTVGTLCIIILPSYRPGP